MYRISFPIKKSAARGRGLLFYIRSQAIPKHYIECTDSSYICISYASNE